MSIKLDEFVDEYNNKKTYDEKMNFIKQHIINEYVPYEKKISVAQAIVDNSYWVKIEKEDGTVEKSLHVNSPAKYMLSCMAIITLYTDIIRSDNLLVDFNILNSSRMIDCIIENIDKKEIDEFKMICKMMVDDTIANEYENHAYFEKQIDKIIELSKKIIPMLLEHANNTDLV